MVNTIKINSFDIAFDKKNPRGENSKQIESDWNFKLLKDHIKEYGLHNPIIIKEEKTEGKNYTLIDGERRLRAAQQLKLQEVLAIVKDKNENKTKFAYQMHMLSKPWSETAKVKSIRQIIFEEIKNYPDLSEKEIIEKVYELTKMNKYKIRDILYIFRYDEGFIKKVEEGKIKRSIFVEAEKKFLPFLENHLPSLFLLGKDKIRKIIGEKAANRVLVDTNFYRKLENIFSEGKHTKKLKDELSLFLRDMKKTEKSVLENLEKEDKKLREKTVTLVKNLSKKKDISHPNPNGERKKIINFEKKLIEARIFDKFGDNIKPAITSFENRRANRKKKGEFLNDFKILDEYDLQDIFYSILRSFFVSVEYEDSIPKILGKGRRTDFKMENHEIIIELKYLRKKSDWEKIIMELKDDFQTYSHQYPSYKIYNYIYDPFEVIENPKMRVFELNNKWIKGTTNYIF